ncbi:FeoB-associated Cys-rich membrane protein [Gimesia sp.]|uniref:FeoB-associated Cys-rich membrane protein n=1 Tax=Gimesia sp. TaxID=2024833 RepID=UPI003A8D07DA
MDQINWQMVITVLCVAAAVLFLVRRCIRFFKQRSGCAGSACSGCPSSTGQPANFISLDQLKKTK